MDLYLERHARRARRREPAPPVVLAHRPGGDRQPRDPVPQGPTAEHDVAVVGQPGSGSSCALQEDPTPEASAGRPRRANRPEGVLQDVPRHGGHRPTCDGPGRAADASTAASDAGRMPAEAA